MKLDNPVFIVGAPKTGSTSIHEFLLKSNLFVLPKQKDTHYLSTSNFQLNEYYKYFINSEKRIAEVDQNLAIHPQAFKNIFTIFKNPIVIYLIRNPEDRFISSYMWLKKMGMVNSIEESLEKYEKWMLHQGDYKNNIMNNIVPNMSNSDTLLLCNFEDLIKKDLICLKELSNYLSINEKNINELPKTNISVNAKNRYLIRIARYIYGKIKYIDKKGVFSSLKTNVLINKLLFHNKKISLTPKEKDEIKKYKNLFDEQQKFLNTINFNNGIHLWKK